MYFRFISLLVASAFATMQQKPVAATLASWPNLGCSMDSGAFLFELQLYLQLGNKKPVV
jgi:hypothetical protein